MLLNAFKSFSDAQEDRIAMLTEPISTRLVTIKPQIKISVFKHF